MALTLQYQMSGNCAAFARAAQGDTCVPASSWEYVHSHRPWAGLDTVGCVSVVSPPPQLPGQNKGGVAYLVL